MTTQLHAITFDLDDTLWDNPPVIVRAEAAFFAYLQEAAPKLCSVHNIESLRDHRLKLFATDPLLRHQISQVRIDSLKLCLAEQGYDHPLSHDIATTAFEHFIAARSDIEPFEDALPMLSELSQNYRLIALTNGNARVANTLLGSAFETVIHSEQLNLSKPDPEFYHQALKRCGLEAQHVLHVGDCPKNDVEGAQKAGLHTLWFNPKGEGESTADIEVQTLRQIPASIRLFLA